MARSAKGAGTPPLNSAMRVQLTILDRYLFRQVAGTLLAILAIVMSLMVMEHLPRLLEITRVFGHRGYIVGQTVLALLPEYAGIGLLVGLYLAIALAVRRLDLRGELDAIESIGIGPRRWMLVPALASLLAAGAILAIQGWLLPGGETRLADLSLRMDSGEFGYNLRAGEFVDLGDGRILTFRSVDANGGLLEGLFLTEGDKTYSAARGRLSLSREGETIIELLDGQSVDQAKASVTSFSRMVFRGERTHDPAEQKSDDPLKDRTLDSLLTSSADRERAAAYGRLLWPLMALLAPALAMVLGRPPARSSSALGVFLGLVVLVTFIKTISFVTESGVGWPGLLAIAVAASWITLVVALARWNGTSGKGSFDRLAMRLFSRLAKLAK